MADYYALITKAVAGLNAQERRTLYERGGGALLAELEAVIPPLGELIITREQLAFDEAIRKVEADARRAGES
jgi:hypothetical protein